MSMTPVYDVRPSVASDNDSELLSDDDSIVVIYVDSISDNKIGAIRADDDARDPASQASDVEDMEMEHYCTENSAFTSENGYDKSLNIPNAEGSGGAKLISLIEGAQFVDPPEAAKAQYDDNEPEINEFAENAESNSIDDVNGSSDIEETQIKDSCIEHKSKLVLKTDSSEVLDVACIENYADLPYLREGTQFDEPRKEYVAAAESDDGKLKEEPRTTSKDSNKDAVSIPVDETKNDHSTTADGDHGKQESCMGELHVNGKSDKASVISDGTTGVKSSHTIIKASVQKPTAGTSRTLSSEKVAMRHMSTRAYPNTEQTHVTQKSSALREESLGNQAQYGAKTALYHPSTRAHPNPLQTSGKTKRNTLKTVGKFKNGNKYVEKEDITATKIPQLGFSARLMLGDTELVIHSKGRLMITDDNFVAKVSINQPHLLDGTQDFQSAVEVFLNQLRIDHVLFDQLAADRKQHREQFLQRLENVFKQLALGEEQTVLRIELVKLVERFKHRPNFVNLCRAVQNIQFKNDMLLDYAKKWEQVEQKASRREQMFRRFKMPAQNQTKDLFNRLDSLLGQIGEMHKETLVAPAYLHTPIKSLSMKHLMFISSNDVKLFSDMSSVLSEDIFEKPIQDLAKRWINRVQSINLEHHTKPLKLISGSFFFICKSLEEVIIEITKRTDHQATDLLTSSNHGWYPINKIDWKSENSFTKCLQREYDFIFRLLKHFDVASQWDQQPFQYEMQLFKNSHLTSRRVLSGVKNALVRTGRLFGYGSSKPNPFGIPDDFYVWYCLLDDVLFHVLPNDCELDMFNSVFERYDQMIHGAKYDQMETLRVVTHNLVRYIAQSHSYGGRIPLNASMHKAVLRKQLNIFSSKTVQNIDSSKNFRDQVEVFNSFWKTRSDIIDQFPTKINLPEMVLMQERLMEIMWIVLDKDVEVEARVAFFRTYNDFIIDLNDVPFDWYIKDIPEFDMQLVINMRKVELLDNKWKNTNNRTYRILNPENFPALCKGLEIAGDMPKHYVIEVIHTLLEHIASQLQRTSWTNGENLSDTDQVLTATELIFAIKSSLLYIKEQIDYVSLDLFYDERVKPFASVLESATSLQDFSNRINVIRESFWYIRKQNEISFDDALQLYNELNSSPDSQLLRESYAKYSKFFDELMQLSVDEDYFARASLIAQKLKTQYSNPTQFKTWSSRYKQDHVPQILAALAAVWSILVSKDVAKAGKYFNPHCIQILCILRLLSVDKTEQGIDKHLAQVLTGQGKSLVLGLLAALFALTGHRVRIACYSKYLAERDEQDFLSFYKLFGVTEKVTYGTFDDLANEIITPTVNGQKIQLRNLVSNLLLNEKSILPHRLVGVDSSNDVLLMDEVDVFFTKEFYGNTYNPCCTPIIPGLDRIQEQIWMYVIAGRTNVENRIQQFIRGAEFNQRGEFLEFLARPNCYTIWGYGKSYNTYTNKTLFDEHVRFMVEDAKVVYSLPANWQKFKLNSAGEITCSHRGIYVTTTIHDYHNVFNYFRLKKNDFVTRVGLNYNYGYLNINCGSLSYAMLPTNYPLIVGVSGTLTSLNRYENDTIGRLYNIKETSLMPSFFGCSNLEFNESDHFHHHATKSSWRTNIFSQTNQMIAANRAVIIFFETDNELDAFKAEYAGQLDRVNVLTENTEDKERLISEAGVAKTITLATRGMGRGVDYKSSVTVEKNGGVHVIQTFFSLDVKEETQIKGRTARKDNKGSYELIVCAEDLRSCGLMSGLNHVTYAKLNAARNKTSLDKNSELSKKIQDSMDAHQKTMIYMRSFFSVIG